LPLLLFSISIQAPEPACTWSGLVWSDLNQ
jgi:hypothetical protein